jgi:hypothetical protein
MLPASSRQYRRRRWMYHRWPIATGATGPPVVPTGPDSPHKPKRGPPGSAASIWRPGFTRTTSSEKRTSGSPSPPSGPPVVSTGLGSPHDYGSRPSRRFPARLGTPRSAVASVQDPATMGTFSPQGAGLPHHVPTLTAGSPYRRGAPHIPSGSPRLLECRPCVTSSPLSCAPA